MEKIGLKSKENLKFLPHKKYRNICSGMVIGEIKKDKSKIMEYLNSFGPVLFTTAKVYDEVKKETVNKICDNVFFDGEYEWTATEKYMFEKYNIELDSSFIKKVIGLYE